MTDERKIAAELAFEVADALEVWWDTGAPGAYDRQALTDIYQAAWARHGITCGEQAYRIFEYMNPMVAELRRQYTESGSIREETPQRPVLH
jgi:hypothetical protein